MVRVLAMEPDPAVLWTRERIEGGTAEWTAGRVNEWMNDAVKVKLAGSFCGRGDCRESEGSGTAVMRANSE